MNVSEHGLVDTNVIVYAYDPSDPAKQAAAQSLLKNLIEEDSLVLSAQVLNEFYWVASRPARPPSLSHSDAEARVRSLIASATAVLPLTEEVTIQAMNAVAGHGFAFWDALLWASAKEHGVSVTYTEDVPGKPSIEGVKYVNPFKGHSTI